MHAAEGHERGQRDIRAAGEAKATHQAVQIIHVSAHKPRRNPSAKWRELIRNVWEADPRLCAKCQKWLRILASIEERTALLRTLPSRA